MVDRLSSVSRAKSSTVTNFHINQLYSSDCSFVDIELESEFVEYLVGSSYDRVHTLLKEGSYFWLFIVCYRTISNVLSGSLQFNDIFGQFLNLCVGGVGLRCLRTDWARSGTNCERLVHYYLMFLVVVMCATSSFDTFELSYDNCWKLDDCDNMRIISLWTEFILTFGTFPVVIFLVASYCNVIRGMRTYVLIGVTVIAHASRCVIIAPVPDGGLYFWIIVNYFCFPWLFIALSRTQEISKRRVFLLQLELKLHNEDLVQQLNDAEKALAFEKPTDQEQAVVAAVLSTDDKALEAVKITFDELELHERIGAGAFGEVIKATYLGSLVAVKRLLRNRIDEVNIKATRAEIMLLKTLRHPNVVQFLGASWDSASNICIVCELVERGALEDVLQLQRYRSQDVRSSAASAASSVVLVADRGPRNSRMSTAPPLPPLHGITWEEPILRMLVDVARGMAYLHSRTPLVLHRDLKPDNVLVTGTFSCKITDFGVSREAGGVSGDMTMMVGTPRYMAPEVIYGEMYTEKVDVYSLGMVLWAAFCLEHPFVGPTSAGMSVNQLMHRIGKGKRPKLPPEMSPSLSDLIQACWQSEPALRPTMKHVLQALSEEQARVLREDVEDEEDDDVDVSSNAATLAQSYTPNLVPTEEPSPAPTLDLRNTSTSVAHSAAGVQAAAVNDGGGLALVGAEGGGDILSDPMLLRRATAIIIPAITMIPAQEEGISSG